MDRHRCWTYPCDEHCLSDGGCRSSRRYDTDLLAYPNPSDFLWTLSGFAKGRRLGVHVFSCGGNQCTCQRSSQSTLVWIDHLTFYRYQEKMGSVSAPRFSPRRDPCRRSILFVVRQCAMDRRRKVLRFTVHQRELCALLRLWRRGNRPSKAHLLLHSLFIYSGVPVDLVVAFYFV